MDALEFITEAQRMCKEYATCDSCPVCGEDKFKDLDADIWCDWSPPFCPNCGAMMDGGVNDVL